MIGDTVYFKDVGIGRRFVCALEVWIKRSANEAENAASTKRSTFEPHYVVSNRVSVPKEHRGLTARPCRQP